MDSEEVGMQHSWIEVNTARLKENIRSLSELVSSEIMFVVKDKCVV